MTTEHDKEEAIDIHHYLTVAKSKAERIVSTSYDEELKEMTRKMLTEIIPLTENSHEMAVYAIRNVRK